MPRSKFIGAALVVGLFLGVACWHNMAAEDKDQPARGTNTANARVEAAKKVYEGSWEYYTQAPLEGHGDIEYYHDWSVRWMQAERDLSHTKAERIAALEGHLQRMRVWKERLEKGVKESRTESAYAASAAEFFRLEAEDWLAGAR
jgi:hypothetical protein